MQKIALTGNIACGKSLVEKFFQNFGVKVVDADKIVLDLYKNQDIISKISEQFCNFDIIQDNQINIPKLSYYLFNDEFFKSDFEKFIHPLVLKEIQNFCYKNAGEKFVIISIPLLFEIGWDNMFDKTILIFADDKIRLKRLMKRNNISENEAKLRMAKQMAQELKFEKADFIIENNLGINDLKTAIESLLDELNG